MRSIGSGLLEGLVAGSGSASEGRAVDRRDPVTSRERPAAARQIHRSMKAWRDRESEEADEHSDHANEASNRDGADEAKAEISKEPSPIATKAIRRKVFRAEATPSNPLRQRAADWARSSLPTVVGLNLETDGAIDSLRQIQAGYEQRKREFSDLPELAVLDQALQDKFSLVISTGKDAVDQLKAFVEQLPPRPPKNAAANPPVVQPGQQQGPAAGLVPQLPPGMTPQQLAQMRGQRDQWLANNPNRVDPNAALQPGVQIRGQNTQASATALQSEGHVMGTNTQSGVHSSFTGAPNPSAQPRRDQAAAAGAAGQTQAGSFRPPFAPPQGQQNGPLQTQANRPGGNQSLSNDPYLGKPMDFDFTLREEFLAANGTSGAGFDAEVARSNNQEQRLQGPGASPREHAAGEFRLGTIPTGQPDRAAGGSRATQEGVGPGETNLGARTTNVQAQDAKGNPVAVPTVQAQNCGTDLMKKLMRLKLLTAADIAMLGADPEGNFLPNCDLLPQQLADHLRWKQADWEQKTKRGTP